MSYVKVLPPKQDEANAVIKSLYICEAKGCEIVNERKAKFCKDHATPESRKEVEAEYQLLHAPHPAQSPQAA